MVDGASCPTFSDLKSDVEDSTKSDIEKLRVAHNAINANPIDNETWAEF